MTTTKLITAGLISLYLAGCAGSKETVLPQNGPDMKTIYNNHMQGMNQSPNQDIGTLRTGIGHYDGYIRDAANEIDTLFPRLPNPTLVMYVFPHLAGEDRTPVPGYVTTFPLYERVEFALPGEVSEDEAGQ